MRWNFLPASAALLVGAAMAAAAQELPIQGGVEFWRLPDLAPNAFAWDRDGNEINLTPTAPNLMVWSGALAIPIGTAGGSPVTLNVNGFFARNESSALQSLSIDRLGGFAWNGVWASEGYALASASLGATNATGEFATVGTEGFAAAHGGAAAPGALIYYESVGLTPAFNDNATADPGTAAVAFSARISELGARIAYAAIGIGIPDSFFGTPISIEQSERSSVLGGDAAASVHFLGQNGGSISMSLGFAYRSVNRELIASAGFSFQSETVEANLYETLRSAYYGGVLGTQMKIPLGKILSIDVQGSFAPLFMNAAYSGYESNRLGDQTFVTGTLADQVMRFAFEAGGGAGLSLNMDSGVRLSVGATARYLNAIPTIERVDQVTASIGATDNEVTNAGAAGPLAALGFTSSLAYGVHVGLTVPLGTP